MWTKVDFMIVLYITTFFLCMALGVYQLRVFRNTDQANSTHKDFAVRIRNMPLMEGTQSVEEQLKERIEGATGQKVVGVSVCWDFGEHEEDVMELLESQLVEKGFWLPVTWCKVQPDRLCQVQETRERLQVGWGDGSLLGAVREED